MPVNFLKSLINFEISKTYLPSISNAVFSLVNNTFAVIRDGFTSYNCELELRTDFQYVGLNKKIKMVSNYTSYYGYNSKYINDDGVYDPSLAFGEFSRNAPEKRFLKNDAIALLKSHTQADSHDAFIYNMLISYGKALLCEHTGSHENRSFTAKCYGYKDSHTTVLNKFGTYMSEVDIGLGPPVPISLAEQASWRPRLEDNYFSKPYVIKYNAKDPQQEAFYLLHVLGRSDVSELNFDFPLPALDTNELLIDPIGSEGQVSNDFYDIPWGSPATIWQYIIDYIVINRLQQVFAATLESFSAMGAHPVFESAEACSWQNARKVLTLSPFSPTRARLGTNLEDSPYVVSPSASDFLLTEAAIPALYLNRGAVLNYMELFGTYAMVHNVSRGRADWYQAYNSYEPNLDGLHSIYSRVISMSSITGHDIVTAMHQGCNVTWDLAPMLRVESIQNYVSHDHVHEKGIPIKGIYAPVSGSLLLGALSGELPAVQHLKAVQEMPHGLDDPLELECDDAVKVANMYRLFGYDMEMIDEKTEREVRPWASAHTCVIEPLSVAVNIGKTSTFLIRDSVRRDGRSAPMPHVFSLLAGDKACLTIRTPTIKVAKMQRRTSPARPFIGRNGKVAPLSYTVSSMYTARQITFKAKEIAQQYTRPSGFRLAETDVPPRLPEPIRVTGDPIPVSVSAADGPNLADAGVVDPS